MIPGQSAHKNGSVCSLRNPGFKEKVGQIPLGFFQSLSVMLHHLELIWVDHIYIWIIYICIHLSLGYHLWIFLVRKNTHHSAHLYLFRFQELCLKWWLFFGVTKNATYTRSVKRIQQYGGRVTFLATNVEFGKSRMFEGLPKMDVYLLYPPSFWSLKIYPKWRHNLFSRVVHAPTHWLTTITFGGIYSEQIAVVFSWGGMRALPLQDGTLGMVPLGINPHIHLILWVFIGSQSPFKGSQQGSSPAYRVPPFSLWNKNFQTRRSSFIFHAGGQASQFFA